MLIRLFRRLRNQLRSHPAVLLEYRVLYLQFVHLVGHLVDHPHFHLYARLRCLLRHPLLVRQVLQQIFRRQPLQGTHHLSRHQVRVVNQVANRLSVLPVNRLECLLSVLVPVRHLCRLVNLHYTRALNHQANLHISHQVYHQRFLLPVQLIFHLDVRRLSRLKYQVGVLLVFRAAYQLLCLLDCRRVDQLCYRVVFLRVPHLLSLAPGQVLSRVLSHRNDLLQNLRLNPAHDPLNGPARSQRHSRLQNHQGYPRVSRRSSHLVNRQPHPALYLPKFHLACQLKTHLLYRRQSQVVSPV